MRDSSSDAIPVQSTALSQMRVVQSSGQTPNAEREWHEQFIDAWEESKNTPADVWAGKEPGSRKLWEDK